MNDRRSQWSARSPSAAKARWFLRNRLAAVLEGRGTGPQSAPLAGLRTGLVADYIMNGRRILHDVRRTATRNLVRAGVSRDVARKLTGHKTDSIFTRYNITDDRDLREAAGKLAAYDGVLAREPK